MEQPLPRNRTFDELAIGDNAALARIVGRDDIDLFAAVSRDTNPAHRDADFAAAALTVMASRGQISGALVGGIPTFCR